jgi:hypothetical protein
LPNDGKEIFKGTPINEEQLEIENIDFELSFLGNFVQQ